MQMTRKGAAVPVVIFVVLAIVLLVFSLAVFGYSAVDFVRELGKGHSNVAKYNLEKANKDFLGGVGIYSSVSVRSGTWLGLREGHIEVFVSDARLTTTAP